MKKIISIILCLAMVLSAVALLSSCKKDGEFEPRASGKTTDVDLSDYTVLFGSELSTDAKNDISMMVTDLNKLTGVSLRQAEDREEGEVADETPEILIGKTCRPETAKALKKVKGEGWTIRVIGDKIVIAGTTPIMTRAALSYFVRTYVNEKSVSQTAISLHKKVMYSGVETVALLDSEKETKYSVVYDDRVDAISNTKDFGSDGNAPVGGQSIDYIFTVCGEVSKGLGNAMNTASTMFPFKDDTSEAGDYEVLVGNMDDRPEYRAEINKLEPDEYGISIKNGKVMLLAWNDVTLEYAKTVFDELMSSYTVTDDAKNSTCKIPTDLFMVATYKSGWVTDFPKPEGADVHLDGTMDVHDNSLEYVYSGSGINADFFLNYCSTLEADGFAAITKNEIEGSIYRTYLNSTTGVTLHVYYSAFAHVDEHTPGSNTILLPGIRIIASTTEDVILPDAELLNPNTMNQGTQEVKIAMLQLNYRATGSDGGSFGNSFILALADGSFIVYDGGFGKGGNFDLENMWNSLGELYREVNGKEPSEQNKIHIRAWILSHEHGDHYTVFTQFVKTYGKNKMLQFDRLLFNVTSPTERVNCTNPDNSVVKNMKNYQGYVTGGFDYIKVHTGQKLYFPGVEIEILYTHEDTYPCRLQYFNNSSTVFRTTFKSGETMIWFGDLERLGSDIMAASFGSYLKSDMVQVAHHGANGVRFSMYQLIAPEVVWWPQSKAATKSYVTKGSNNGNWYQVVDYRIMEDLPSAEIILVADDNNYVMTFTGSIKDCRTNLKYLGNENEVSFTRLTDMSGGCAIDKRLPNA